MLFKLRVRFLQAVSYYEGNIVDFNFGSGMFSAQHDDKKHYLPFFY